MRSHMWENIKYLVLYLKLEIKESNKYDISHQKLLKWKKINFLVHWKDEDIFKTFKFTEQVKLYRWMSWVKVWGWITKSLISSGKRYNQLRIYI